MKFRSILIYNTTNSPKIKVAAKVWMVQIKLPCGFCLKENTENVNSVKWSICQILN